jgi:hypothetical protein
MPRKKVVESTAVSTTKLTPAGTLTKLRTNYRGMTRENAQNRANYGAAVKIAVDEKHLHKGAWAIAMREDKMEPAELRSHYEHLEHYRRELGLIDRAESAPELPMEDEAEAEEASGAEAGELVH